MLSLLKTGALTAAALITLGAASVAHAAPILIDFTNNSQWSSTTKPTSKVYGGVTVTVQAKVGASNGTLTYNPPYDGGTSPGSCKAAGVLKCDNDGLGVQPNNDDEYRGNKSITVTFSSPVSISRLFFLDLFAGENGKYDVNGTSNPSYTYASPTLPNPGGYWEQPVALSNVTSLKFYIPSQNTSSAALAGIETVPTPSAISLLLIGLAASGATLRKRRASQVG
jgi:hypothetical protein